MNDEERLESILDILDELKEKGEKIPIIVEGEKDDTALRKLGVSGHIRKLNIGISIFHFCEELSREYDKAIILTDWDRKGGHLSKVLRDDLQANQVKANTELRAKLSGLCRMEIKDVESLPTLVESLKKSVARRSADRFALRRKGAE